MGWGQSPHNPPKLEGGGRMELKFTVTPKQLKEKLRRIAKMDSPPAVFLWGKPGIGKTQIVYQVGEEVGKPVKVMILSLMDPTELKGFVFPDREKKRAEFFPLNFPDEPFILFFDEFNTAPTAVQNAAMRIVLEKKIGDYELPEGTLVVCAGNRLRDKATVNKLSSAMVNRALHYSVVPDFDDFKEYWMKKGLPEEVVAYLELDTKYLSGEPDIERPYPSPRAWEMVGRLLQSGINNVEDIAGIVGEEAAVRFVAFMKKCTGVGKMVGAILRGEKVYPKTGEVEKSFMLATVLVNKTNKENLQVLLDYALEAPDYMSPYIVLWMKTILKLEVVSKKDLFEPGMTSMMKFAKKYKFVVER